MENAYNNFRKSKAWDNPELRSEVGASLIPIRSNIGYRGLMGWLVTLGIAGGFLE